MKKNVIMKFLFLVLMVVMIFGVAKSSFAVSTITPIENANTGANSTPGNNATNNAAVTPANTAPTNRVVNNNTTNNNSLTNEVTANNAVVNNSPVNNTVIPATGAKSVTGLFILMGIFGVSAVYTFVKLKKYEI